jgi:hypothetical protein
MRRWMLVLIFLITAARGVSAQAQAVIRVSLVDAAGAPVSGAEIRFRYESGTDGGSCVTGDDGTCEIAVASPPPAMIRGYLEVVGAGKRSLIWPGGSVDVSLRLKADGTVEVATETIGGEPTPVPTVQAPGPPTGGAGSAGPGAESGPGMKLPLPSPALPAATAAPAATATAAVYPSTSLPTVPPPTAAAPERAAVPEGRPRWMWAIPAAITAAGVALLVWGVRKWRAAS